VVRIVVLRPLPEPALELLRGAGEVTVVDAGRPLTVEEAHEAVRGASAVVSLPTDRIDGALLDAAGTQLKVVANFAVGFDNLDLDACRDRGVAATNTPDTLVETTADLAFALILGGMRRVAEGDRLIRARRPWTFSWDFMLGRDAWGTRLGIVGFGAIGQAVARRAAGFRMEVVYTRRRAATPEVDEALGARRLPLDELLETSDVVTLHVPLTHATRHLIDGGALRRMRRTAHLVNTARGPVVDEAALVEALQDGTIASAGLDVFEHEPDVHPGLLELENVLLVPHLGSATIDTRARMALRAARNVIEVLAGRPAPDDLTVRPGH
jgi:lactate dehydrogenase-like 2-hydroxyacid dehydrogenase